MLALVVASELLQLPAEPARCCTRYRSAPATALQVMVNDTSDSDTLTPCRVGPHSATSVTVIATVVVAVPPSLPSRASTVRLYDDAVS